MPYCGPPWQIMSKIEVNTEEGGPRDGECNLILMIPSKSLYPAIPKATM